MDDSCTLDRNSDRVLATGGWTYIAAQQAVHAAIVSQSSKIFGALAIGFIFFITVRGELVKYLGVVGIGPER